MQLPDPALPVPRSYVVSNTFLEDVRSLPLSAVTASCACAARTFLPAVRVVVSLHASRRGFATDEHALACFAACGGDEDALHRPRAARHADHRRCAAHALLPHGGSTARLWPTVPGELRLRVRVKIPSGLGLAPARRTYRPPKASPRPDHALTRHLHPDTSPQPRRRWRSSWRRCSSCPSASR